MLTPGCRAKIKNELIPECLSKNKNIVKHLGVWAEKVFFIPNSPIAANNTLRS